MRDLRSHAALCLLLLSAVPASAADPWLEVTSPHFTVVSNTNERRARDLAWQFEQIRAALLAGWPWARERLDRPVYVVAAKDESTMKQLAPAYWERRGGVRPDSVFVSAPDRYYVALRADTRVDGDGTLNPYLSAYWSYVGLMLDSAFERELPLWLRNGLAGVLSNSIVGKDQIKFGMPIPWHFTTLQEAPRLKLPELMATETTSPYYTNQVTREHFDAQAWALVHFMLFGQPAGQTQRINDLVKLLLEGRPSVEAAQAVFGSLETLQAAHGRYLQAPTFPYSFIKVETKVAAGDFATRALSGAEAAAARAALHLALGRPVEAQALAAESKASAMPPAAAHEVAALMAEHERRPDDAKAALLAAAASGSTNYFTYFRLAAVSWPAAPTGPDAFTDVERFARRAVTLNEAHVPSLLQLASALAAQSRFPDALPFAVKAASLEPRTVGARLTLARVLWGNGRRDDALAHGRAAQGLARSDQERNAARQLLEYFEKLAAAR